MGRLGTRPTVPAEVETPGAMMGKARHDCASNFRLFKFLGEASTLTPPALDDVGQKGAFYGDGY